MKKFIKVYDTKTKEKLINFGFKQIDEDRNGISTFLNNQALKFDKNDLSHIIYTNILTF